jgi:hypothetical protein
MQRSLSLLAVVVSSLFGCSSTDQAEALPSDGAGGAETGASGNAGGGSAGTGGVKGTGGSTGSGGAKATGGATGSGGRVGGSGGILAADAGAFCDAAVPGPRADDQEGMPPHGLFAASGSGKVLLLWSAPPEISRFTIYRGTSPGAEDPIPLAENVNGVTYLDATAADDTRFYYRVSAAMPGGSCLGGPLSNEATARPTGADAVAAFGAVVANDNPFTSRSYSPTPIPSYDAKSLPQPIVDEAPEWLSLYAKAWQLAFREGADRSRSSIAG